jgi:hypothetical protein
VIVVEVRLLVWPLFMVFGLAVIVGANNVVLTVTVTAFDVTSVEVASITRSWKLQLPEVVELVVTKE